MKIAFFVQYYNTNGTFFRWHNLAIAIANMGHEVDVYASDHNWRSKNRIEYRDNITYHIIPSLFTTRLFYAPNDPLSGLRRLKHLPEKEYDVYHLYQPFLHAYISWHYLKRKKKKAIFIYDWDDLWTDGLFRNPIGFRQKYLHKVTAFLEKHIPKVSDGITVCSNFLKNKIGDKATIKLIGNGYWESAIPDKTLLRKKWQFDNGIFYVAYIGKTADELDWVSGILDYLNTDDNVRIVIAGPPKSYIQSLNLDNNENVIYLGELSPDKAREVAAAVNLGLIPLENSLFNQSRFPIKFFDFLSVQTPVYLSDVGEIALLAKKLDNAFVGSHVKEKWSIELIELITQLKARKEIFWEEEEKKIVDAFTWSNLATEQIEFYKKVKSLVKQ